MNHLRSYNETILLKSLKEGSEEAFETIYSRYVGKLYNFMLGMTGGNEYMAEEMVQIAFIALWETRDRINPDKSIISYLAVIAKNTLFNKQRRQTVEFLYREQLLREETVHDVSTEQKIEEKWLKESLNEIIEKMPPGRQRVFRMSRQQGLSTKEIAEKLGITVSTVETQISLGLKYMRKEFMKNRDKLLLLASIAISQAY